MIKLNRRILWVEYCAFLRSIRCKPIVSKCNIRVKDVKHPLTHLIIYIHPFWNLHIRIRGVNNPVSCCDDIRHGHIGQSNWRRINESEYILNDEFLSHYIDEVCDLKLIVVALYPEQASIAHWIQYVALLQKSNISLQLHDVGLNG